MLDQDVCEHGVRRGPGALCRPCRDEYLERERAALMAALREEETMEKIRPLHDRLIVERSTAEERSPGGIIIPENAKEKPVEGRVLAAGKGALLTDGSVRPLDVKAGDRVLFGKFAGTEVTLDGSKFLMLREEDVLGVIEPGDGV